MVKAKGLTRTQIQGKKYDLPLEEVNIQKLIKKGLSINEKMKTLKQDLEAVKNQLILIAENRREGSTTVKLQAVSGVSTITFRESYVCDDRVDEIAQEIGSLFDRFFTKTIDYKTTKELKHFLEGEHAHGIEEAEAVKNLILSHVKKQSTKANVKIVGID